MDKQTVRLQQITEILKVLNGASIKDLAHRLGVSEMTIRRDLRYLDKEGITKTLHGSTFYNVPRGSDDVKDSYSLELASTTHADEKDRIGKFAASLVSENDIISIDTGSTTVSLAHYLDKEKHITILCYNSNILEQLLPAKNFSLIFSGGYFHDNTLMFESPESLELIKRIRTTKTFVSAAGFHKTLGVTGSNAYETASKRALLASSVEKILLMDSSKFSQVKSAYFADIKEFSAVVTDKNIDADWSDFIRSLGIKLYVV